MDGWAVLSGFGIGAIVGLTGVGGGSLMTPLLIGVFQLNPVVAVGTDLCFAALTKSVGAGSHHRAGHVDWRIVRRLLAGSIPASLATLASMERAGVDRYWADALTFALGVALLVTAASVAFKPLWPDLGLSLESRLSERRRELVTIAGGVLLGVLVSLSSVGAGAIGAAFVTLLYPRLAPRQVVGTDIAHAVPLTLIAGIGHAVLGHVNWSLLEALLTGSLPGIWLGAQLTRRLPDTFVRSLLCVSLAIAGVKVI